MSGRPKKRRLDDLLVERGLAADRETAARLVMAGQAQVTGPLDGTVLTPGIMVGEDETVSLREQAKFVSRGGLKLERALDEFEIDVTGMAALDVGASTGGFTDCLLQRGASRVYAVDAGRGQLHNRLLNDPRVVSMERTNARKPFHLPEQVDIIVADVSFISLLVALPPCLSHLKPGGLCVALVKPQFEARRGEVGEGGVISDDETLHRVVSRFQDEGPEHGLKVERIIGSPVRGDRGNREFLSLLLPVSHVDPPDARP
jgi:23S rRNA (cytidine1920-2'-O)/16S rRNA (cytidine1409-2'-O)-methyltransferase